MGTRYLAPVACALLALAAPGLVAGSGSLRDGALAVQATGSWTAAASMTSLRSSPTATRLVDGRVLVVGGEGDSSRASTAELYDSSTGTWASAGTLNEPRTLHVAVRLADGRVLVAGGGWYGAAAEL